MADFEIQIKYFSCEDNNDRDDIDDGDNSDKDNNGSYLKFRFLLLSLLLF